MCRECKVGILRGGCSLSKHTVGSQQMCRQSMCVLPRMCTCACLCGSTLGIGMSPGMNRNSPLVYVSECICEYDTGMRIYHVHMYVYVPHIEKLIPIFPTLTRLRQEDCRAWATNEKQIDRQTVLLLT